jgi:hypothetical protein
MTQPKWKELQSAEEWRILIDETGHHDPEVEVAQEISDAPDEERFQLFRVPLERFKVVIETEGDTRFHYLVPIAYETSWPHPASSYVPWFNKHLGEIADSAGTDRETLIEQLCSPDPVQLFRAYADIGGHFGWREFDSYPIRLSKSELNERWDRDEPDPLEPFRYRAPNARSPGGGPVYVEKGSIVRYRVSRDSAVYLWARVLDRIVYDDAGKRLPGKWLRVLALTESGDSGHVRWIPIESINHCHKTPNDFLSWFFSDGPAKIDPETIVAMSEHGSLSERYISAALDRLEKTGDFRK